MKKIHIIQFITFISAFLLFQIEFIIGKIFLPNFGGSYLVWGLCMVFFQTVLLLGYMYADIIHRYVSIYSYRRYHLFFILLPLLFFPGNPLELQYVISSSRPIELEVFWKLLITIGPVFFVLSTMCLIWQIWLSDSMLQQNDNPYALFAASNLGSVAALLSYPFIFEYFFDLQMQQVFWRVSYGILTAIQFLAYFLIPVAKKNVTHKRIKIDIKYDTIVPWLLYGGAGVVMFLAVTNIMTSEIAPVPLIWMLPMAIYLFSFVLNFKRDPWCPAWIKNNISLILGFGILLYFVIFNRSLPIFLSLVILLVYLFVICMFCQERLYALRPSRSEELTYFYLMMSIGSLLGGICATWIVPLLSVSHMEYFIGILIMALAWQAGERGTFFRISNLAWGAGLVGVLFIGLWFLKEINWIGITVYLFSISIITFCFKKNRSSSTYSLIFIILFLNVLENCSIKDKTIFRQRNYYGINEIIESSTARFLVQGSTIHGGQILNKNDSFIPITYFHPRSPVGSFLLKENTLKNIGIIGLGTGALSVYLGQNQSLDFFELDPDVLKIAQKYFTFLDISKANVRHILGDARKSIEKMEGTAYEAMIIDAFSGDSLPIHLVTLEAIETYRKHLTPDGIIIFNITNRFVDFVRPLAKTALASGGFVGYKHDLDYISKSFHSDWIVLSWNKERFTNFIDIYQWKQIDQDQFKDDNFRPWSDQYSSIIPFFKIDIYK